MMRSSSSEDESMFGNNRPRRRHQRDGHHSALSTRTSSKLDKRSKDVEHSLLTKTSSKPDKRSKEVETLFLESSRDRRKSSKPGNRRTEIPEEPKMSRPQNFLAPDEAIASRKSSHGPIFLGDEPTAVCPPPTFSNLPQRPSSDTLQAFATVLGIKSEQAASEENRSVAVTNPQKLSAETLKAYQTALGINTDQTTSETSKNVIGSNSERLSSETLQAYPSALNVKADHGVDEGSLNAGPKRSQWSDKRKNRNKTESRGSKRSTDCFDRSGDHGAALEKIGGKLVATPSSSDLEDDLRALNLNEMNEEQLRELYDYETSSGKNFCEVESAHTCEIGRKFKAKPGSKPGCRPLSGGYGAGGYGCEKYRSPCTIAVKEDMRSEFGRNISEADAISRRIGKKNFARGATNFGDHVPHRPKIESRGFDSGRKRFDSEVDRFGRSELEGTRPIVQVYEHFGPSKPDPMPKRWGMDSRGSGCVRRFAPKTACYEGFAQNRVDSDFRSSNRKVFDPEIGRYHLSNRKRPGQEMVVNSEMASFKQYYPTSPERGATKFENFHRKAYGMPTEHFDRIRPYPEIPSRHLEQKIQDSEMGSRYPDWDRFDPKSTSPNMFGRKQFETVRNVSKPPAQTLPEIQSIYPDANRSSKPPEIETLKASSLGKSVDSKASMLFCQMLAKSLPDAKMIPFDKLSEILPEAELAKINQKIDSNIQSKEVAPSLIEDTQLHIDRIKQQVLKKAKDCLPNATFSKINQFLLNSKSESEPELARSTPSSERSPDTSVSAIDLQRSGRSTPVLQRSGHSSPILKRSGTIHEGGTSPSRTSPKHKRKDNSYYNYMYPVRSKQRRAGKTRKRTSEDKLCGRTEGRSQKSSRRRPESSKTKREPAYSSSGEDISKVCNSQKNHSSISDSRNCRLSSGCESDARFEEYISCDDGELVFMEYDDHNHCNLQERYIDDYAPEDLDDFENFDLAGVGQQGVGSFQNLSYASFISHSKNHLQSDNLGSSAYGSIGLDSTPVADNLNLLDYDQNVCPMRSHCNSYDFPAEGNEFCLTDVSQRNNQNFCQNFDYGATMRELVVYTAENALLGTDHHCRVGADPKSLISGAWPDLDFHAPSCQRYLPDDQCDDELSFNENDENCNIDLPSYPYDNFYVEDSCSAEPCFTASNQCQPNRMNFNPKSISSSIFCASFLSDKNETEFSDGDVFGESNAQESSATYKYSSCLDYGSLDEFDDFSLRFETPTLNRGFRTDPYQFENQSEFWRGLYDPTEIDADESNNCYSYLANKMIISLLSESKNESSLMDAAMFHNTNRMVGSNSIILKEVKFNSHTSGRMRFREKPYYFKPQLENGGKRFRSRMNHLPASTVARMLSKNKRETQRRQKNSAWYQNVNQKNWKSQLRGSKFEEVKVEGGTCKKYLKQLHIFKSRVKFAARLILNASANFGANFISWTHSGSRNLAQESRISNTDENIVMDPYSYPNILVRVPGITPPPPICVPPLLKLANYAFNDVRISAFPSKIPCQSTPEKCKISDLVQNQTVLNLRGKTTVNRGTHYLEGLNFNATRTCRVHRSTYRNLNHTATRKFVMFSGQNCTTEHASRLICLPHANEYDRVNISYSKCNENSDSSPAGTKLNVNDFDEKSTAFTATNCVMINKLECRAAKNSRMGGNSDDLEPNRALASDLIAITVGDGTKIDLGPLVTVKRNLEKSRGEVCSCAFNLQEHEKCIHFSNHSSLSRPLGVIPSIKQNFSQVQVVREKSKNRNRARSARPSRTLHSSVVPSKSGFTLHLYEIESNLGNRVFLCSLKITSVGNVTPELNSLLRKNCEISGHSSYIAGGHFPMHILIILLKERTSLFFSVPSNLDCKFDSSLNSTGLINSKILKFCELIRGGLNSESCTELRMLNRSTPKAIESLRFCNQFLASLSANIVYRSINMLSEPKRSFYCDSLSRSIFSFDLNKPPQFKPHERPKSTIALSLSSLRSPVSILADDDSSNERYLGRSIFDPRELFSITTTNSGHKYQAKQATRTASASRHEQSDQSSSPLSVNLESLESPFNVFPLVHQFERFEFQEPPINFTNLPALPKPPNDRTKSLSPNVQLRSQLLRSWYSSVNDFGSSCITERQGSDFNESVKEISAHDPAQFQITDFHTTVQFHKSDSHVAIEGQELDSEDSIQVQARDFYNSLQTSFNEQSANRSLITGAQLRSTTNKPYNHLVLSSPPSKSLSAYDASLFSSRNLRRSDSLKSIRSTTHQSLIAPEFRRGKALTQYAKTSDPNFESALTSLCFPRYYGFSEPMHSSYFHLINFLSKWFFEYRETSSGCQRGNPRPVETAMQTDRCVVDNATQTDLCLVSPESFEDFLLARILSSDHNFDLRM